MKIVSYEVPKSRFLSVDKDLSLIADKLLKNKRLQKLLYYTTPDAMNKEDLTEEQAVGLFGRQIRTMPKILVDSSQLVYVIISFEDFHQSENPEFRDNTIAFDIICHYDNWMLNDSQQRPYRIAGEIDSMIDKKKLTGIGQIEFLGCNQVILNDEFAGLSLVYKTYHGGEDQKGMPNPQDEEQFIKDFNKMFNQ